MIMYFLANPSLALRKVLKKKPPAPIALGYIPTQIFQKTNTSMLTPIPPTMWPKGHITSYDP